MRRYDEFLNDTPPSTSEETRSETEQPAPAAPAEDVPGSSAATDLEASGESATASPDSADAGGADAPDGSSSEDWWAGRLTW